MSQNGKILAVVAAVLIVGGAWWLWYKQHDSDNAMPSPAYAPAAPAGQTATSSPSASAAPGSTVAVTVHGTNYAFNPATITVRKGDTVQITFVDDDGFHNLVVDGYNVQTQNIGTGASSQVTFTADKTGSFAYYCSIDSHRAKGMQGTLIVE